jgi:hypothetical protein
VRLPGLVDPSVDEAEQLSWDLGSAGSAVSRLVMPWRYGASAGMSSLRGIQIQGERRAAGRLCGRTWRMPLGLAASQLSDLFDL